VTLSPGASASAASQSLWTLVEQDLGSTPSNEGSFTVTDSRIAADNLVVVVQAPGPLTDKGDLPDESVLDPLWCVGYAWDGGMTVYWQTLRDSPVVGNFKFYYTISV